MNAASRTWLSRATTSAPAAMSVPSTVAVGRSRAIVIATHPEPVHRSSARNESERASVRFSATSTRISVSGRGTSTRASTRNGRP